MTVGSRFEVLLCRLSIDLYVIDHICLRSYTRGHGPVAVLMGACYQALQKLVPAFNSNELDLDGHKGQ